LPGFHRSAAGLAYGPRVSLEVDAAPGMSVLASYGEGFRSPMALLLQDGERAPFAKVRSADLGIKQVLGAREQLELRASGFFTHLNRDVAFEPADGSPEPIGPTQRAGFVLYGKASPLPWLFTSGSVTYAHATLQKPPAPSAEDPTPAFQAGQRLPYVPPVVLRADASAEHRLFDWRDAPVNGRAGLGYTYWSRRPLPYDQRTAPVSLLDAELSASYRAVSLALSCFNLLDAKYSALELSYASNWNPDAVASRLPMRHIMAGAPRTFLATLAVTL
jgi:outer membrane receptor protein involved in Fe transport